MAHPFGLKLLNLNPRIFGDTYVSYTFIGKTAAFNKQIRHPHIEGLVCTADASSP